MSWFLLLLSACADDDAPCAPDLAEGTLEGTLDDAALTASDAAWRWAGSSLQANASGAVTVSVVLQTTTDGEPVTEAVAPFTVDLGPEGGGWVVVYPEAGSSLTTQSGSGSFEIVAVPDLGGGVLSGCFSGTVSDGAGDDREVSAELVANASPL
jgi:hypothetical protein